MICIFETLSLEFLDALFNIIAEFLANKCFMKWFNFLGHIHIGMLATWFCCSTPSWPKQILGSPTFFLLIHHLPPSFHQPNIDRRQPWMSSFYWESLCMFYCCCFKNDEYDTCWFQIIWVAASGHTSTSPFQQSLFDSNKPTTRKGVYVYFHKGRSKLLWFLLLPIFPSYCLN